MKKKPVRRKRSLFQTRLLPIEEMPTCVPFHIGLRPGTEDSSGNATATPLTTEDFLHPQDTDRFLASEAHLRTTHYLCDAVAACCQERKRIRLTSERGIDWQRAGSKPLRPDVAVFDNTTGIWDPKGGTMPVSELAGEVAAVFEVTQVSTRHIDFGKKYDEYARAHVPYYIIVDIAEPRGRVKVRGYRLVSGIFRPMRYDPQLGFMVPPLRMWFRWSDGRLIASDEDGKEIPPSTDMAERLLKEKEQMHELRLLLDRESNKFRESERQAESEQRVMEEYERRVQALQSEIHRLRTEN